MDNLASDGLHQLETALTRFESREELASYCQATTREAFESGSAASRSWTCGRKASRKPGDDPRYCWQHQDRGKRY